MKIRSVAVVMVVLALMVVVLPVSAEPPPLPSSFYGQVRLNGASVADGTLVTSSINGVVYASYRTMTYPGWGSVYSLDVSGDQLATLDVIEGGREGDVIVFAIGGTAVQKVTWHSGTNTRLDLSGATIFKAGYCRLFTFLRECR